jgi:Family of unknown function (DUF5995)
MHDATPEEPQDTSRNIEDLIAHMQILLGPMESDGDPRRCFLGTYLRTTRAVADELASGNFLDPAWVERWDVFFASLYLDALKTWNANGTPTEPWRVAFAADAALPVLRHVLLGINAHINYDLPLSLLGVIDDAEFADPNVMAKRNQDHTHIDAVLLGRVGAEDEAITAAHGGKNTYERLKAPLERRATGRFLREARAKVWANTRLMAAARSRGDAAGLERLRAELARLSAAKLDELAQAREVLLHLWIRGFGVRLDEPQGRSEEEGHWR